MLPYLAEFIGTALLVLLGDGVCANVNLSKSGMKGGGTVHIALGWAAAVMIPAFIFGAASGASFNPALTIALAADGSFEWAMVPGYVAAQMLGGFVGAILVWILFKKQFDAEEDAATILGVFSTGPSIHSTGWNIVSEAIATFILVFAIKGMGQVEGMNGLQGNIAVFAIIMACGMSTGGTTGYAMNPARDLSPRIAHAVLPIPNKGGSNWGYALVPVVGSIVGALLAVGLFAVIPWA